MTWITILVNILSSIIFFNVIIDTPFGNNWNISKYKFVKILQKFTLLFVFIIFILTFYQAIISNT